MILVFGLLDRQSRRLERDFGDRICCWPRHRPLSGLLAVTAIVVLASFVSHAEVERLVRCYGRERLRLVYGGDSSLRRELLKLTATA